jgi:large subunit ribosomal protein L17
MRHRKVRGRLNRRSSWRKATLKSLANDLFEYEKIETTLAKAKALKRAAEPLITMARKDPSPAARRKAFGVLCDRAAVKKLFDEIAPLYKETQGGYLRIMPSRFRKGDGAELAVVELVKRTVTEEEAPDTEGAAKKAAGKGRKRRKRTSAKAEKKKKSEDKQTSAAEAGHHSAPEVDKEAQEERAVEKKRKDKARAEKEKINKKGKGIFKRFRRKST